jgi:AbrB family looped-hinge helix DNA binding protein
MTQEDLAEKVGVTRQAVAKWESGESVPDLEKSRLLAQTLEVSLDELVNHEPDDNLGVGLAPKGKHLFGIVTVGDKGQIVIPAKARKLFNISTGDNLVVLGDENQGMAILKEEYFLQIANAIKNFNQEK